MMTKEEIEAEVRVCRDVVDRYPDRASACDRVASHLADENATLRAQLAEAVALFEQERKGSKSWWEAANRLVAQLRGTL